MKYYEKIKTFALKHLRQIPNSGSEGFLLKDELTEFIRKRGKQIKYNSKKSDLIKQIIEDEDLLECFSKKNPFFINLYFEDVVEYYDLNKDEYNYLISFNDNNYSFDSFKKVRNYERDIYSFEALTIYNQDELKNKYKEIISDKVKKCHLQIKGNTIAETESLLEHVKCFFHILNIEEKSILINGKQIDVDVKDIPSITREEENRKSNIESLKSEIIKSENTYIILKRAIDTSYYLHNYSGLDILLNLSEKELLNDVYQRFCTTIFYILSKYKEINIIEFLENNYKYSYDSNNLKVKKIYNEDPDFRRVLNFMIYEKYFKQHSYINILNTRLDEITYDENFFNLTADEYNEILNTLYSNKKYKWCTIKCTYFRCFITFWSKCPKRIKEDSGDFTWGITDDKVENEKQIEYKRVEIKCDTMEPEYSQLFFTNRMIDFIFLLFSLTNDEEEISGSSDEDDEDDE